MTIRKRSKSHTGSQLKWIHIRDQSQVGFQTVIVWAGQTVEQFKQLLALGLESTVTVPGAGLPLPDTATLFDYVKDFDTVLLNA